MSWNWAMHYILILNVRCLTCHSTEAEWWRCSTPRVRRTGSSTLWTGVWMGWDRARQQHTTGTVRQGPQLSEDVTCIYEATTNSGFALLKLWYLNLYRDCNVWWSTNDHLVEKPVWFWHDNSTLSTLAFLFFIKPMWLENDSFHGTASTWKSVSTGKSVTFLLPYYRHLFLSKTAIFIKISIKSCDLIILLFELTKHSSFKTGLLIN